MSAAGIPCGGGTRRDSLPRRFLSSVEGVHPDTDGRMPHELDREHWSRRVKTALSAGRGTFLLASGVVSAIVLTGCASAAEPSRTPGARPSASSASASASPSPSQGNVEGTVVRFTADGVSVDVVIGTDTPATRDFLSMLPMTIELEDLSGREKIGYLPRELKWRGSPGSDPEDGDLIYFTPWGNIGFYYDAAGIDYSDQTLHLGTYRATAADLARFEGRQTSVEIVG